MFFFTVATFPTQPAADRNDACWSPLLGANAIARDYPIPERRDKVGLELPLSLMMELVGEVLSKIYDKGIYIYFRGDSRLLFPTAISDNGTLQWHLVTSAARREALPVGSMHLQNW